MLEESRSRGAAADRARGSQTDRVPDLLTGLAFGRSSKAVLYAFYAGGRALHRQRCQLRRPLPRQRPQGNRLPDRRSVPDRHAGGMRDLDLGAETIRAMLCFTGIGWWQVGCNPLTL